MVERLQTADELKARRLTMRMLMPGTDDARKGFADYWGTVQPFVHGTKVLFGPMG
jgi:hypothetical protein